MVLVTSQEDTFSIILILF